VFFINYILLSHLFLRASDPVASLSVGFVDVNVIEAKITSSLIKEKIYNM